jgi:4-aminobutyrate aminotransferase-like enzyme
MYVFTGPRSSRFVEAGFPPLSNTRQRTACCTRGAAGATHAIVPALTGNCKSSSKTEKRPQLISSVLHFMNPRCYRCPFGWTHETCQRECVSHAEKVVESGGPDNVAAIAMEGGTGSNGLIVAPDNY